MCVIQCIEIMNKTKEDFILNYVHRVLVIIFIRINIV